MIIDFEQETIPEIGIVGDEKNFRVFPSAIWSTLKGCRENDVLHLPDLQCYLPAKNLHKLVMLERKDDPVFHVTNLENSLVIEFTSRGVKSRFTLKKIDPLAFRDRKQVRIFTAALLGLQPATVETSTEPAPQPQQTAVAEPEPQPMPTLTPQPKPAAKPRQNRRKTVVKPKSRRERFLDRVEWVIVELIVRIAL